MCNTRVKEDRVRRNQQGQGHALCSGAVHTVGLRFAVHSTRSTMGGAEWKR